MAEEPAEEVAAEVLPPLTLGTAGHIDHGKTALVDALTGVNTDRLPEERRRGVSIELGYAPLVLPSGRRLSVIDVPGHERFVRTMVAGATGIDAYLMVVAADDGVMPQTREHAAVLSALGVDRGVVAITKADLIDPDVAMAQAAELMAEVDVVAVSSRTGEGVDALRRALDRVAAELPGRAAAGGGAADAARLHVDRVFTIRGAGTVVTGTLWAGSVGRGDTLRVLPRDVEVRVRGVQVHDAAVIRAVAGQRVALNLVGIELRGIARGDVVAAPQLELRPSYVVDAAVDLGVDARWRLGDGRGGARSRLGEGGRIHVHHGTRDVPARVVLLGGRFVQLRLERPIAAVAGDRLVLRQVAPPDTLGGGVVLDPAARKHGPARDVLARLERIARGEAADPADPAPGTDAEAVDPAERGGVSSETVTMSPQPSSPPSVADLPPPSSPAALAVEQRLRAAWFEPPILSELSPQEAAELPALREAGRVVRVGRQLHYHPDALAEIARRVVGCIEADGSITLAALRDELGTTRKFAQALLEHLDASRLTLRVGDKRVLRRR